MPQSPINPRISFERANTFVKVMNKAIDSGLFNSHPVEEVEAIISVVDQLTNLCELHAARELVKYQKAFKAELG